MLLYTKDSQRGAAVTLIMISDLWVNEKPTYLFNDSVHLIKNVRYNLLSRRKSLFPPFTSERFITHVKVLGGDVLRHHHEVHKFTLQSSWRRLQVQSQSACRTRTNEGSSSSRQSKTMCIRSHGHIRIIEVAILCHFPKSLFCQLSEIIPHLVNDY